MAGMLSKFIGGAAEVGAQHFGNVAKQNLEIVRQQRLQKMGVEAEEARHQRTMERERNQLTDPESNLSLREKREMDAARQNMEMKGDYALGQREKELQLESRYGKSSGSGGGVGGKAPKIYNIDVEITDPITGELSTIKKPHVWDSEQGRYISASGLIGDKGALSQAGGVGSAEGEDPHITRMRAKREAGKGKLTESAEANAAEATTDTKAATKKDTKPKHYGDASGFNREQKRKKMRESESEAYLKTLFDQGDADTIEKYLSSEKAKDMGFFDLFEAKQKFQAKFKRPFKAYKFAGPVPKPKETGTK